MAEISDLNANPATNTARFGEGQIVPQINDGARELEAILARWHKDTNGSIVTSGAENAYAILTNRAVPSHAAGLNFRVRAHLANTGASTLTINALASKPLRRSGGDALANGDIAVNQILDVTYNAAEDYYECLGINA